MLATGGLSLPKTGSDGGGFLFARELGHSIQETHPCPRSVGCPGRGVGEARRSHVSNLAAGDEGAEDPGRAGGELSLHPLWIQRPRRAGREPALFPWGPRLPRAWGVRAAGPGTSSRLGGSAAPPWEELLKTGKKRLVVALLKRHFPRRLAERLLRLAEVPEDRCLSAFPRVERLRLIEQLTACPLELAGDEGYGVAEVTAGGVPLDEVVTRTLESRHVPGLHFAGEILDVDGRIGGFNFLWAWASGRRAGQAAAPTD